MVNISLLKLTKINRVFVSFFLLPLFSCTLCMSVKRRVCAAPAPLDLGCKLLAGNDPACLRIKEPVWHLLQQFLFKWRSVSVPASSLAARAKTLNHPDSARPPPILPPATASLLYYALHRLSDF